MKRRLVQAGTLPERKTRQDRIANMDKDVRDLADQLRRGLTDKSFEFHVEGYTLDEDSWEAAINGRTVVLSVVIERPE